MFGDDMSLAMRLILALVVVLALIGFTVLLLKRFGMVKLGGMSLAGRQPRLAVMDIAHLDSRRKLVIVRRDAVEHLVMIGGPNDVVIEQGIVRGQPVAGVQKDEKVSVPPVADGTKSFIRPISSYLPPKAAAKTPETEPASLGTLEPPTR
jgi:flagellar protein FliO/FliZ